ncbi:hypothetical protein BC830DRAFT_1104604 [Chytriomyces sp. MP71]|nr:hypothetical protein BC830DRAFT_1104604 [Chytriomyces sp. MP71]
MLKFTNRSLAPVGTGESASSHPTTQAIFPLFVLVINQSYDYISGLWNASESSVLSRDFMEEIESNPQNFAAFVTSASWSNMYEKNFYLASREGEAEEISAITALKKRYAKVSKPYVQKVARQDMIVTRMSTDLETHINVLITRREGEYYMLIPEALVQQDQERRLVVRRWLAIFHALTQERGIWLPKMAHGSESTSVSSMVKWKLDRTENHLRMHQRFIQNFEFDDHSDAAQKRDRTPSVNNAISVSSGSAEVLQQLTNSELAAEDKKKSRIEKLKQHNKTAVTIDEIKLSSHSIGALISNEEDLAVEEWDVINNDETAQPNNSESEKILCGQDCEMILLMTAVKGRLELSSKYLTFFSDLRASAASMSYSDQKTLALVAESEVLLRERRWSISKLREAYFRRYKLRNSAIEFFFTDGSNCFFNFKTPKPKLNLMSLIVRLRPQNLKVADPRNPMEMIGKSDITERWQRREISNFEYLMHLNTVSGRTSNDLTQYPVFPWILKDYTSTILDLSDPNVYRDLSKPIGALDPTRLQQYIHRFENFDDPSGQIKKFMYGTHYSSSAAVLFYMLRVEPFTSLHIALQGGKFDHPDRQFDSIEGCWKSVLTGNGDVKELIPEFFYMPEFLVNENGFDLGTKQTGTQVNHVTLPPWASSPEEFIRIHREALEGDFVSAHLHEWIDLIWGYKQTGPESVKAHNVFYYLTYEGAINIDSVQDPVERRSIEDQINNFGQTPTQLFKKAHPARLDKSDAAKQSSIFSSKELDVAFSVTARNTDADSGSLGSMPFLSSTIINASVNNSNKVSTNSGVMKSILGQNEKNRMITVDSNLLIGVHRWSTDPSDVGKSFLFEADTSSVGRRRLPCYLATDVNITQNLFAVSKDAKYLFTGGHWDSSFQVIAIDLGYNSAPRTMDTVYGHHDIVTSLALSEDGSTLVTGSRDTTVIAWEVVYNASGHEVRIQQNTRRVFYGHDEEVSCVTVHTEQDLVVSGSLDGTCIVHALGSAQYIRTIKPAAFTSSMEHAHFNIAKIVIMKTGLIIHSEEFGSMMVNMPDQANVNSVIPATSVDDLKKNRDSIIANRSAKSSYLDVFSVNGKVQCSRRFSLTSLDDFVASRSGTTLFLTSFEQPFAAGPEPGEKRGGLTIELVNSHDLTTIFKQSVSGSTRRKSLGGMRDRSTTLHTVSNEQCLFVGYTSDQVLVFVAQ